MSKLYFIGIDPGLGVKSATGVCVLDSENYDIVVCEEIWTSEKRNHKKFYEISSEVRKSVKPYIRHSIVATEFFVMRGKSGQSLQRLIGTIHASLSECISVIEPQNVIVKQAIGGEGGADKEAVGRGLLNYFEKKNESSHEYIEALLKNKNYDALDAIAIAVTALLTSKAKDLRKDLHNQLN